MAIRVNSYIIVTIAVLGLTGCAPQFDMQGYDPVDYYTEHPIKNKIEDRSTSYSAYFIPSKARMPVDEADHLRSEMRSISMLAVDSIQVRVSKHDMADEERKDYLERFMRSQGYNKGPITFVVSDELSNDHIMIDLDYAVVTPPNCPDWRTSSVTTYSNTTQGNFYCAQEVNTGLMVADPHDLIGGNGDTEMDTGRAAKAVQNYEAGIAPQPAAASGATGSSSSSSSSTPAAPQ